MREEIYICGLRDYPEIKLLQKVLQVEEDPVKHCGGNQKYERFSHS